MMEKGKHIKIALTVDVEPNINTIASKTGQKYSGLTEAMPKLLNILTEHQIPVTWFITHDYWGKIDEKYPSLVEQMANNGEIGCHVHFGTSDGVYCTNYDFQMKIIEKATNSLRNRGYNVKSFRGGALFFDQNTLKVLEVLNYEVDSSVLPGMYSRPDTNLIVNHKECLSTKPYFPSYANHCSKILEIPLAVYPYFRLNTNLVSVFIARSLPMPLTAEHLSITKYYIKKLSINKDSSPIVLFTHPWNFIDCMEKKFYYLEQFIRYMKLLDVKFVTLSEIRTEWKSKTEIMKKSKFTITTGDILQLAKPILKLKMLKRY